MKVFLYPMLDENGDITTSENLKVHRMNCINLQIQWKSGGYRFDDPEILKYSHERYKND
jgi:hypothetical protein